MRNSKYGMENRFWTKFEKCWKIVERIETSLQLVVSTLQRARPGPSKDTISAQKKLTKYDQ